jgi:hypothetical protein
MDNITNFYLDSTRLRDQLGFTYSDCMSYNLEESESCHGYIQWLFPNREPSAYNANAPYPSEETLAAFVEYPILRQRMVDAAGIFIMRFAHNNDWITPRNHNLLRITRIIKCLRLFGMPDLAQGFYVSIMDAINRRTGKDIVGPVTLQFWQDALNS